MRKERTLLILGIWVIILPYLGFPSSWRSIFLIITGLALIYLSYIFYKQAKAQMPKDESIMHSFIDNIPNK